MQNATQHPGFTLERTFKAPPEKVWKMWTTPEGIGKWWVLSARDMGYDMTVRGMDVRVGGRFAFEMKGNGHALVNGGTYTRVEPVTALAWTWHFDIFLAPGEKPYDVPISVTLARTPAGGTRMVFTQGPLATREHTEGSRQGVLSNFKKLAEALEDPGAPDASDADLVVTRTFAAPREKVFRAWTDPERLARWWAPAGAEAIIRKVDARPGGVFHYGMRMPDGKVVWGIATYREVVPPDRLVYVDAFADEDGNAVPPSRYGASAAHPAESLVTVTFAEAVGGTTVTLRHAVPRAVEERAGMEQGWTEMLDRLASVAEA